MVCKAVLYRNLFLSISALFRAVKNEYLCVEKEKVGAEYGAV